MHEYYSAVNSLSKLYLDWLREAGWQAGLLALMVLLAVRLYPRMSPFWGYALLIVALAKFAMPSGLSMPVSLFELVQRRPVQAPEVAFLANPQNTPTEVGKTDSRHPSDSDAIASSSGSFNQSQPKSENTRTAQATLAANSVANSATPETDLAIEPQRQPMQRKSNASPTLVFTNLTSIILIVISGTYFLWLLFQFFRIAKIRRGSVPVQENSLNIGTSARVYLAGIKIATSAQLDAPIAVGVLRPTIILPESALRTNVRHLEAMLLHEAAHIRRRDLPTLLVEHLLVAIWWFHPMLHLVRRQLSCLRERCCDEIAIEKGNYERQEYCQMLLDTAKSVRAPNHAMACGISSGQLLGKRILGLMQSRRLRSTRLGWQGAIVLTLLALFALPGGSNALMAIAQQKPLPAKSADFTSDASDSDQLRRPAIEGFVQNADGEPDGNATVIAFIHRHEWDKDLAETQTDARGYFSFRDCPQGSVTLTVYNAQKQVGGRFCGYLREHERFEEQRIKLFNTAPVKLRVINDAGEPVSGAELSGIRWRVEDSEWFWLLPDVRNTIDSTFMSLQPSDASGIIVIPGVPRHAECIVQLQHADLAQTESNSFKAALATTHISMKRGNPIHIDVIDANTKEPVPDAYVRVSGNPSSIYRTEKVDKNGKLTLRLADARDVTIHCYHPDMVCPSWFSLGEWGMPLPQETTSSGGTLRGEVYSSTSTSHTFKLYPKGKVQGNVVDEKSGLPLAGVDVYLTADNRQQFTSAQTDEKGNYELTGPADFVTLKIRTGNGFWAADNQKVTVKIEAGEVVEAKPLKAKRLPVLKGRVIDERGNPVDNAIVFLAGSASSQGPTLTDSSGDFQLEVARHDLHVTVEAASLESPFRGTNSISFVDFIDGRLLEICLVPEGHMRGKLVDVNGSPLANRELHLYRSVPTRSGSMNSRSHTETTDQEGNFVFHSLEGKSRYRLTAYDASWKAHSLSDWCSGTGEQDLGIVRATAEVAALMKQTVPEEAPELACPTWFNSEPLDLENVRGKVVLLDFWGTWCGPCVAELPMIQKAHELYANKGLVVIGLHNNMGNSDLVRKFLADRPWLTYAIAIDQQDGTTCSRYDVSGFPTAVLIGRDGKILQYDGLRGADVLLRVRESILYDLP